MLESFIIALILCCLGFKKYVYFLSVGYGFAIGGLGARFLIESNNLLNNILSVGLILYGCRLSGFLLYREFKNQSFRNTEVFKDNLVKDTMALKYKVLIWLGVGLLYALQTSPILFRIQNNLSFDVIGLIGFIVMIIGLTIETLADLQKSKFKKTNSGVCMQGLYKIVRCPNYWGEILFWLGVFISGIPTYKSIKCLIISLLGLILITFVMFNGAKRLEKRQLAKYSDNEEFMNYCKTTPIILPLLPIYSLKDVKYL